MKILTVVGARPQFIKAAAVSRVIRNEISEVLVHTGQHYDNNMSDIFFRELSIPKPDYNLGVGSGSHARQTAEMLIRLEEIMSSEKPDYVMLYGDTNSTLAGALAAVKIHIPIVHVEAGLRSFNMQMPEEVNRILTDRVSDVLLCPTDTAVKNLENEGITRNVFDIGDVMCDAVHYYADGFAESDLHKCVGGLVPIVDTGVKIGKEWYLATIHRAENTDDINKIERILGAFERLDAPVIFPVHPRTKSFVRSLVEAGGYKNTLFCEPIGYREMLFFLSRAKKLVTDSGGLQKEAYILKTQCVTVRQQTEWVETLKGNWNTLSRPDTDEILHKVNDTVIDKNEHREYYGDGHAAEKLLNVLTGRTK